MLDRYIREEAESANLIRERVYQRLRAEIISCALQPGAELHEGELAQRFAVSKSPIRDALVRLHAERLVLVQPRKGYRVMPVSLSDARDLFQFRATLENICARNGAASVSDEALGDLDRFRRAEGWDDKGGFVAYNRAFHIAVAELCANRRMVTAVSDLIEQFDRVVTMSMSVLDRPETADVVAEHGAIIDALQARNGRRAGTLLVQHIGRAERRALSALQHVAILP